MSPGRAPKRRNYAVFEEEEEAAPPLPLPPTPPTATPIEPATGYEGEDNEDDDQQQEEVFLDIGCGSGRFLLLLARRLRRGVPANDDDDADAALLPPPMMRMLLPPAPPPARALLLVGIDAQPALVSRANAWAAQLEEQEQKQSAPPVRCRFLPGDAARLLQAEGDDEHEGSGGAKQHLLLPLLRRGAVVVGASIHFPDPVLAPPPPPTPAAAAASTAPPSPSPPRSPPIPQRLRRCPALDVDFARQLASLLASGAPLLVQSECRATAEALVEGALLASGEWEALAPPPPPTTTTTAALPPPPDAPWWCWTYNPLGVPTEREVYLAERARLGEAHSVWRALLVVRRA
jgi:SAM-dependent methyltransferase